MSMNAATLLMQGSPVSRGVAALLLAMSVTSWVVIVWKTWLLRRAAHDVVRSTAAFWQATSLDDAQAKVTALDRVVLVSPLVAASRALDALKTSLTQTAVKNPDTEVQLRADQAVPYGKVVEVMGAAQKAGLNRIGFVADAPASTPSPASPLPTR